MKTLSDNDKADIGLGRVYMCLYFTMRTMDILLVNMPYELDFIATNLHLEIDSNLESTKNHLLKLIKQANEDSKHLSSLESIRARGQELYQKIA